MVEMKRQPELLALQANLPAPKMGEGAVDAGDYCLRTNGDVQQYPLEGGIVISPVKWRSMQRRESRAAGIN